MSVTPGLDIVIPMAGRGSRFAQQGYTLPKPLVDVKGEPMIRRVIENLRPNLPHRFIFLVLEAHRRDFDLDRRLKDWAGPQSVCVSVTGVTEGAACTVLLAAAELTAQRDLLIANSDQLLDFDCTELIHAGRRSGVDGAILVFEDSDPKWSFARLDQNGWVEEVAEKRPISNLATVGLYHFRSGQDFVQAARSMIAHDLRTNGEFYVCPVYNQLIQMKRKITVVKIPAHHMHGIGTPEDLKQYLRLSR